MIRLILLAAVALSTASLAYAAAPIAPAKVVSVDLLVAGLEQKMETLGELLADPEKYDDNEEFVVRAGGVIAVLSQALIEHDESSKSKIAAPALRDIGLGLQDYVGHEEASDLYQQAQSAMKGEAEGEHEKDHPWDELIGMYEMMEEMNDRNGGLSRSLRRSRGKVEEQLNASTNAVLSIAMLADHSYLEDEDQAEQWDEWSKQCIEAMKGLTKAIEEKDQTKIAEFYKAANRACDQCHEVHRAE
ncbi:hypothetical protein [Rubinisphaera margarita]|uniref:hypothetical protein n=1 Tax=Rubinisphaera margarita TaxID=2909586 RepID=UPI001EE99C48|nr:hypothetical protein [Rubinisphaera margarita]MCG6155116.1 hypothetical protein [Rubinisphaera margarita]